MAGKKDKAGAGRAVTTAGAAGEPPGGGGALIDQSFSLDRVDVVRSKFGATKGEELRRETGLSIDARGADGRAQMFKAATAQSRDRGKTWDLYSHVTGKRETVVGGTRALNARLTAMGKQKYTQRDAERAREDRQGDRL